jgi:hypothetical protein
MLNEGRGFVPLIAHLVRRIALSCLGAANRIAKSKQLLELVDQHQHVGTGQTGLAHGFGQSFAAAAQLRLQKGDLKVAVGIVGGGRSSRVVQGLGQVRERCIARTEDHELPLGRGAH